MIIYKITNKINNKCYIGKTIHTIEKRWKKHVYNAIMDKRNSRFYCAIRKYGPDNFALEIIEQVFSDVLLDEKEIFWIAHYDATNKKLGYNMAPGGEGGFRGDEAVKKMADKRRGIPLTKEHRERISKSNTGRKHSKRRTPEQRLATSIRNKQLGIRPKTTPTKGKFGELHHFYGKTHSDETKQKISLAGKGRKNTKSQIEAARKLMTEHNPMYKNISKEEILEALKNKELTFKQIATSLNLTYHGLIFKIKKLWGVSSITELVIETDKINKEKICSVLEDISLTTFKIKAKTLKMNVQLFVSILKHFNLLGNNGHINHDS